MGGKSGEAPAREWSGGSLHALTKTHDRSTIFALRNNFRYAKERPGKRGGGGLISNGENLTLKIQTPKAVLVVGSMAICFNPFGANQALAHHSFAMYDQTKVVVLTGVVYQFVAQANHAELHIYLLGPDSKLLRDKDGKLNEYGIEMAGAAAVAEQGITADSMKAGTIISVKVNPLRDGTNFGSKAGSSAVAKCPWKQPPAPGQTCEAVQGSELLGATAF
jgi:hypothetical protein